MAPPRKYPFKKTEEAPKNVTREQIEAKLNEIDEIVNEATDSAADMVKIAIGVGIVVVVGLAFLSGRRRALRSKTLITFIKSK